jgi:phosphatidylserine/phosphatidylglycerophosphate/cardiolipin synthase-like enzyme
MKNQIVVSREFPLVLIPMIKEAKQSIKILMYSWRWYPEQVGSNIQKFNMEIIKAKRRGVQVSAVVNFDDFSRHMLAENINIKATPTSNTMHIKMILIDSKYLITGSHNLTMNAFEINHEMSLISDDSESVKACETFFDNVVDLYGLGK